MGEQRLGETRCTYCIGAREECWVYSANAEYAIANAGQACARCRTSSRKQRCSLVTRQPARRGPRSPPPGGPTNSLFGPPGLGGGSAGAAVPVS
jgi:hypothetical protein